MKSPRYLSSAQRPGSPKIRGFTLVELMVTIAVLGILIAIAMPSFKSTIERWRVNDTREAFVASYYLARSEAIKRGGNVLMVKHIMDNGCTVPAGNGNWGCGWDVCVANGPTGGVCSTDGADMLQQVPAPTSIATQMNASTANYLRFNRWGHAGGLGAFRMTIYPEPTGIGSAATSSLCVTSGGRVRFEKGAACS